MCNVPSSSIRAYTWQTLILVFLIITPFFEAFLKFALLRFHYFALYISWAQLN